MFLIREISKVNKIYIIKKVGDIKARSSSSKSKSKLNFRNKNALRVDLTDERDVVFSFVLA